MFECLSNNRQEHSYTPLELLYPLIDEELKNKYSSIDIHSTLDSTVSVASVVKCFLNVLNFFFIVLYMAPKKLHNDPERTDSSPTHWRRGLSRNLGF